MSCKRNGCVVLALVSLAFSSSILAAELRGRLTGLPGAGLVVTCPDGQSSTTIASSGNYTVRGLASGKNCSFKISASGAESLDIAFNTSRSVTIYSGNLVKRGNRIVVIRQ